VAGLSEGRGPAGTESDDAGRACSAESVMGVPRTALAVMSCAGVATALPVLGGYDMVAYWSLPRSSEGPAAQGVMGTYRGPRGEHQHRRRERRRPEVSGRL
jgi:hypothetical protein